MNLSTHLLGSSAPAHPTSDLLVAFVDELSRYEAERKCHLSKRSTFLWGLENKDSCGWVVLREGICVWKEGVCVPSILGTRDPQSAADNEFSHVA